MDSAVATGAFTLGGVVLGGGLDWIRSSLASKRAEVGRRDELIAALDTACISLLIEIRSWRTLDTSSSKLRQLAFGMLETGLPELPASGAASLSVSDFGYLLIRWIGASTAKRLQHQTPVALVDTLRRAVMPFLSEVSILGVRPGFNRVSPLRGGSFRRVLRTQALRRGGCRARHSSVTGRLRSPPYPAAAPASATARPTRSRSCTGSREDVLAIGSGTSTPRPGSRKEPPSLVSRAN